MRLDVFTERARQLSDVRKLISGEPSYASAIALVSVHAAIALNDAVLIQMTGTKGRREDHMDAAGKTSSVCRARGIDDRGIAHLRSLLSAKSDVSYGSESVSFDLATKLSTASERFEAWAERVLGGRQ
jgi:hypothetical protein